MNWRALVQVFNKNVVQSRIDDVAIGFPTGESEIFKCSCSNEANRVRDLLRKWLRAHLEDNGVELSADEPTEPAASPDKET